VLKFHFLLPILLIAAICVSGDKPEQPLPIYKTEVGLVNVVFSALDGHERVVPSLDADDFRVFEDRIPQQIKYFSPISKGDVPLTIALLMDTSASIRDKLDYAKQTAAEFLRSVVRKDRDSALLIQFHSEVDLVHDFTRDPEELIRAMQPLRAGGSTALYDAVLFAVNEKLKSEIGRKVIVLITDGDDSLSNASKEMVIEAAQKQDVLMYCIGIRSSFFGSRFRDLKKFAEETGGRFFSPRAKLDKMEAAFQSIHNELENQYSLAYTSTNYHRDGAFRAIKIRCTQSGVRIRARKGYYAPTSQMSSLSGSAPQP
jgi:VWFA-related protein